MLSGFPDAPVNLLVRHPHPCLQVLTTTGRYNLLAKDMDFNAGLYQDGTPMPELGMALLKQTIDASSGALTAGERAGHAQVRARAPCLTVDPV